MNTPDNGLGAATPVSGELIEGLWRIEVRRAITVRDRFRLVHVIRGGLYRPGTTGLTRQQAFAEAERLAVRNGVRIWDCTAAPSVGGVAHAPAPTTLGRGVNACPRTRTTRSC